LFTSVNLPFEDQGQGAAQGIEDAATLGALISTSTPASSIPDILHRYNELRYSRATTVMLMSKTLKFVPDAQLPENMFEYTWKWNAIDMARKV
jgi:salicylate hydroxylase